MNDTPKNKTTWVWKDSQRRRRCMGAGCGEMLTFAQNSRTGREMPFEGPALQVLDEATLETPTGPRQAVQVPLSTAHFATCRDASRFRRGGRKGGR